MSQAPLVFPYEDWLESLVSQSLAEDVGGGDVSTELSVMAGTRARGQIVARQAGVVAGLPVLHILYGLVSSVVNVELVVTDGDRVTAGMVLARLQGPAAALLAGERVALNFLQHLSGIATLTARYVDAVADTGCRILDTRKTVPGFRSLAKYAVRAGGGHNHRMGLYDRIMLKDNHWAASTGDMASLVARARQDYPHLAIEIEVDSLEQLATVLPLQVEWILLDNFTPQQAAMAVKAREASDPQRRTRLEASGNIDLDNVRDYAETGVEAVSIGRLTHSAPAVDVSFELELLDDAVKGQHS